MARQKTKFILALTAVVVAAVLATVLAVAAVTSRGNAGEEVMPPLAGENITVEGEHVCLPKPGPGPHTMECAFGLRTDDGEHYGLDFTSMADDSGSFPGLDFNISNRLLVSGTFTKEADNIYDSLGTIEVESAEGLE